MAKLALAIFPSYYVNPWEAWEGQGKYGFWELGTLEETPGEPLGTLIF